MLLRLLVLVGSLVTVCWCQAERRAPQMGFMGMRGKKYSGPPGGGLLAGGGGMDQDKRAAPMGFQGLRGKKNGAEGGDDQRGAQIWGPDLDPTDIMDKRASQMGFMGMRGKKDHDYFWDIEEDKRAAPAGFFGMRGKKGPSGFFGMRGKKGPSGFFGMRGKKGPSGFLGVRGKKDNSQELEFLLQQLIQDPAVHQDLEDIQESRLKRSIGSFEDGQEFFISR